MDITVRVIYEKGLFRPLSPIDLPDGEELEITLKGNDYWQTMLGDLLVQEEEEEREDTQISLYDAVAEPIEVEWGGGPTASEIIIQERD